MVKNTRYTPQYIEKRKEDKTKKVKKKICAHCKKEKGFEEFHKKKSEKDNLDYICKSCRRNIQLYSCFNITPEDYKILFDTQNGYCAICGIHQSKLKKFLGVDHNHNTGIIRGLLCDGCNGALGSYENYQKEFAAYLKTAPQRMVPIYKRWLENRKEENK